MPQKRVSDLENGRADSDNLEGDGSMNRDMSEVESHENGGQDEIGRTDENIDEEEDDGIDETVREDMKQLDDTFPGISQHFRLVNRIGEGRFKISELPHTPR